MITRSLRHSLPRLQVSESADLQFRERRVRVMVVGLVEQIGAVRVKARGTSIDELANALDQAILQARLAPDQIISRAMIRDSLEEHFKVVGELRLAYSLRRSERDALTYE